MPKKQKSLKKGIVNPSAKKQKKRKSSALVPNSFRHRDYFLKAMAFPEHVGPFRIPRQGSVARTVLGMDHRFFTAGNNATDEVVRGWQMGTNFSFATSGVISVIKGSTSGGNLTITPGTISGGVQYPVASSIHDANLVSGCFVVSYLGTPLECSGEVIVGVAPQLLTDAVDFDTLMLYPGTTWISMVDLMNKGAISIALRHLSPKSYEFKAPANAVEDLDTPFVIFRGLHANSSVKMEWVRNWECRANPNREAGQPNSISYESASGSFTQDLGAFQDASALFARLPEVARIAYNQGITDWMSRGKGGMMNLSDLSAVPGLVSGGSDSFVRASRIFHQIKGLGGSESLLPKFL